jgi:ABC-2 type transport system permease protein
VYGIGFAFASLVITLKEANAFVFLVRGIVMIFCGITYPLAILPGWMQSVSRWLPQTYIIHGVRTAALSTEGFSAIAFDLQMLVLFGIFWLTVGYFLFNMMERRARQSGAIGQY